MNAPLRDNQVGQRTGIVDCDIHPAQRSAKDLYPFLSKHWIDHLESFGMNVRQALSGQHMFPRTMAAGMRVDAYPGDGSPPGSDLALMQRQHLDPNGVEFGMLVALGRAGMEERNQDFAAALSGAVNDWQIAAWVEPDPRLQAGIVLNAEDPIAAVAEIEKRAPDPRFKQIIMSPRSAEPLGRRRYWPIYEAAQAAGLPIGFHPASVSGGSPSTGAGWPTYDMGEHYTFGTHLQEVVVSLVMEGVFERFPGLKVVCIESGFSWAVPLGWRMDKHWQQMRAEVPHLKRPPSEYMREHLYFTTQPIEEPPFAWYLNDVVDWIGWDHLMFSSDYPHWDFDDPRYTLRFRMTEAQKSQILRGNAKALYKLP